MATLISSANGNFTATSWSTADTTSLLTTTTAVTVVTTSFATSQSSTFTPGAITIDGIGTKLGTRTGSSGTLSIELYNNTGGASVAGTTVTINVSDLPNVSSATFNESTWIFFKFAAPVTLIAATAYRVRMQTSVSSQVSFYRDATASNWTRFLRTTTTASPAASDSLIIVGEVTSAGSGNDITITHNNTATTTFADIELGNRGKWVWGTAASTNYYFKTNGNVSFGGNSYLEIGDPGATRMPSTSSATIELASTGAAAIGIIFKTTSAIQRIGGATKIEKAFLAANASAGASSLTTNISTGWLNGDEIGIASTTRTNTEAERKTLNADASGTSLSLSTTLSNTHGGVSPTVAEVINLTRNIKFKGASTSNTFYVSVRSTDYKIDYVEHQYIGSVTNGSRSVDFYNAASGSSYYNYCAFKDGHTNAVYFTANQTTTYILNCSNNVMYGGALGASFATSTGATSNFNNNVTMACTAANGGFIFNSPNINADGCISTSGAGPGFVLGTSATVGSSTYSNLISHSNATFGFQLSSFNGSGGAQVSNISSWRNGGVGMILTTVYDIIIDTFTAFGNLSSHYQIQSAVNVTLRNADFQAGSTLTTATGFLVPSGTFIGNNLIVENSNIGTSTAFATADIQLGTNSNLELIFRNCTLASSTNILNAQNLTINGFIAQQKISGSVGSNRVTGINYVSSTDSTIYDTSPYSQRITPSSTAYKAKGGKFSIAVANGRTATVRVKVRKSVVGDGAAYNGANPRLILMANPNAGSTYNSDIVCATASGAAGSWETLSYTLPSASQDSTGFTFYIDCDGTAGWINWDTVSVS